MKKYILVAVFSYAVYSFVPLLFQGLNEESLSEGWKKIKNDPWAYSAIIDYVAGLILGVPYLYYCISSSSLLGLIMVLALVFLGNPVLLGITIIQAIKTPSLKGVFLPFSQHAGRQHLYASSSSTSRPPNNISNHLIQNKSVLFWKYLAVVICAYYSYIVIVAIKEENVGDGWSYIKKEIWAYIAFMDNLLGIVFTACFISVREYHICNHQNNIDSLIPSSFKWLSLALWLISLASLGNGVTCLYVYLTLRNAKSIPIGLFSDLSVEPLNVSSDDENEEEDENVH